MARKSENLLDDFKRYKLCCITYSDSIESIALAVPAVHKFAVKSELKLFLAATILEEFI